MYTYSTKADGDLAPRNAHFFDTDVIARRRTFLDTRGVSGARAVAAVQEHGGRVCVVTEADAGKGIEQFDDTLKADALISDVAHIPLVIKASDCVSILMWSDDKQVVAAIHAGWRSIVAGVVRNTGDALQKHFDIPMERMPVWIGPHLRACCFTVGDDENGEAIRRDFSTYGAIKGTHADATKRVIAELEALGVDSRHIDDSGICTLCDSGFFSNRRGDTSNNLFVITKSLH